MRGYVWWTDSERDQAEGMEGNLEVHGDESLSIALKPLNADFQGLEITLGFRAAHALLAALVQALPDLVWEDGA